MTEQMTSTDHGAENAPLLNHHEGGTDHDARRRRSEGVRASDTQSGFFFEHVAAGIQDRDRERMAVEVARYTGFIWAIVSCLCAGSLTAYSLYAPLFQSRLHYTQYQVNLVSIASEVALYLPVPFFGYVCDRYGPRPACFFAAISFGFSYLVAAFAYRSGPPTDSGAGDGWPVGVMVAAFVGIGAATSCMYIAAVSTCAKNFGRGKHKGFAMAAPIASFGLSGMWQSQVGSRLLYERAPDGSRGDVDVFRYFLFLSGLLFGVAIIGTLIMRVVDESELIDEAVEELERSGLLEDSDFFQSSRGNHDYGTMQDPGYDRRLSADEIAAQKLQKDEEARKKTWLLNEETRRFLSDHTMWWLAGGFFLISGPGDAFINNLGTIIGTLYPPPASDQETAIRLPITTPATHVSIVALTSTLARLFSGALSDLVAPVSVPHQHRRGPTSLNSSLASLDPNPQPVNARRYFTISRLILLFIASSLSSLGFILLASGAIQYHASPWFALVSALVGTGYGASFSLVPIIISCVWGVENFGTNWGIVAVVPAVAGPLWGIVYAANYSMGASPGVGDAGRCYGKGCYMQTYWGMAAGAWVAIGLWIWAWRGPNGWRSRGVAV